MQKIVYFRKLFQVFILVFFVLVPLLNVYEIYAIRGNLLAFSFFGIPLIDPFSAFQALLGILKNSFTSDISFLSSIPLDIIIGMSLILLLAFCLGSVFCSWLCPYGFFSELGHKIALKNKSIDKKIENNKLFYIKYIVFLLISLLVFFANTGPIGNLLSMPAWYTKIWQYIFLYGQVLFLPLLFIFAILGLEIYFKKRIWCLYICPQSLLISLASKFSPLSLRVKFQAKLCTCKKDARACIKSCSLQLNPRNIENERLLCTNCAECIKACNKVCTSSQSALNLEFGRKNK